MSYLNSSDHTENISNQNIGRKHSLVTCYVGSNKPPLPLILKLNINFWQGLSDQKGDQWRGSAKGPGSDPCRLFYPLLPFPVFSAIWTASPAVKHFKVCVIQHCHNTSEAQNAAAPCWFTSPMISCHYYCSKAGTYVEEATFEKIGPSCSCSSCDLSLRRFAATEIIETLATYAKFHATWLAMAAYNDDHSQARPSPIFTNWNA